MKCTQASPASDLWSLGVIIFMLVTGGFSPFYSRNNLKMQKKILRGNYNIENEQFKDVSRAAKDMVRAILVVEPDKRITAKSCEDHDWLAAEESKTNQSLSEVRRLETQAMRRWLARRRWTRAFNIVRATIRLSRAIGVGGIEPGYLSSEEEIWL